MKITCNRCDTSYVVENVDLGANGRNVRCVRCGHTWFMEPEEDTSRVKKMSLQDISGMNTRKSGTVGSFLAGRAVYVATPVLAIMSAVLLFMVWPIWFYPYNMKGGIYRSNYDALKIEKVSITLLSKKDDGSAKKVTIFANIVNPSQNRIESPLIKIIFLNNEEKILTSEITKLPTPYIESSSKVDLKNDMTITEDASFLRIIVGSMRELTIPLKS